MYFATGATHAPHHAPAEFANRYKGKFDGGWDQLREDTLARQIKAGVVPAGTKLTPRPAEIPAWDSLSADQKRLFARQMEVFAGFAEHTDYEVGRLVQAFEEMGSSTTRCSSTSSATTGRAPRVDPTAPTTRSWR